MVSQGRFHCQGIWGTESPEDRVIVEKALFDAGLSAYAELPVTELSGGELQRVLIARAMAQGTRLLLLDEPVNSLDPKYTILVMDMVKNMTRQGKAGILSLHDLNLADRYADRVAVVAGGTLVAGKPEEMLKDALETVFGWDAVRRD
jgi:iron complex transport system ATP-binding protein